MEASVLRSHKDGIESAVRGLDAKALSGEAAAELVLIFSSIENSCAIGRSLCAARVKETSYHEREGHRDPESWLAEVTGDSRKGARDSLRLGDALEELPGLKSACSTGGLSEKKAVEVAEAGLIDEAFVDELLERARTDSLFELKDRAERMKASARSKEEADQRHARLRANRHLRTYKDGDGSFCGRFALTPEDGALVMGRIEQIAGELFDKAHAEGREETRQALLADALVELARTGTDHTNPRSPDYRIIMRIDLEALLRGSVRPGETCEVDGTGPIPVSIVQSYLDRAGIDLVVTKGIELVSIFSFKRTIPRALRTALEMRDRTCVVPGCSNGLNLEIDHIREFARGGPTSLENTCRLCHFHHRLKSTKGYRITGGPGEWAWLFPAGTVAGRSGVTTEQRPLPGKARGAPRGAARDAARC